MGCRTRHSVAGAARAEATHLARESNRHVVAARRALDVDEARREIPVRQEQKADRTSYRAWHGFRRGDVMTSTRLLFAAGLFSLSAFACASDPNKQASDAHDAELKSERKQEQANADQRGDLRVNAAEAERGNTTATATGTPAAKKETAADAKLAEARAIHRAKATERLEKTDARVNELKALVTKAGPKATTASRDALTTVDAQHGMVTRELDQLPNVPNDN
jgi:hypothetical protein